MNNENGNYVPEEAMETIKEVDQNELKCLEMPLSEENANKYAFDEEYYDPNTKISEIPNIQKELCRMPNTLHESFNLGTQLNLLIRIAGNKTLQELYDISANGSFRLEDAARIVDEEFDGEEKKELLKKIQYYQEDWKYWSKKRFSER